MAQHPNMHLCKIFDLNFSAFLKKINITFKVSNSSMFCIKNLLRSISLKSFGNILEKYIVRLI